MKRSGLMLALSLACLGCVEFDMHLRETPARPAVPVSAITTPITAQQVNPENARRMAQNLSEEIDRDDLDVPTPTNTKR